MRFYACLAILSLALVHQAAWAQPSTDKAQAATGVAAFESPASVPATPAPGDSSIAQGNDSPLSTEDTWPKDEITGEQGIEGIKALLKKYWLVLIVLFLGGSWWVQGRLTKRSD